MSINQRVETYITCDGPAQGTANCQQRTPIDQPSFEVAKTALPILERNGWYVQDTGAPVGSGIDTRLTFCQACTRELQAAGKLGPRGA